ncbi:MAG: hypothetical protein HYV09_11410 [Deltaproteobacteria bacterium]|nr:hypothetical protein [Deltaproteobacteria bacterium]
MTKPRIILASALFTALFVPAARADATTKVNQPPRFSYDSDERHHVHVGDTFETTLDVNDPDDDPITFSVTGLPAGATSSISSKTTLRLRWKPTKWDVGPHDIVVQASDGKGGNVSKSLHLTVEDNWRSYFMPGASYSTLLPVGRGTWGTFQGVSAEILIASWIHRNENRGPSHGRVYLDMDVLRSTRAQTSAAFDLSGGFDLSIERNPIRHWMLPFFGMKTGAFIQKDLEKGSVWHVTPLAGAYLWADKNLFLVASAGYMMPISARHFDELRGLRVNVGLNFSLW